MAAGGYSEPKMAMGYKFPPKCHHDMVFGVPWAMGGGGGGGGGKGYKGYLTHPLPKVFYYYVLIRYCKGCTFGLDHS